MHNSALQGMARIGAGISLLLSASYLSAQDARTVVRGVVRSASGPVPGANVFILETLDGVLADSAGRFTIRTSAPFPVTLHVKRIGFAPHQRAITDSTPVTITLERTTPVLAPITVQAGAYTAGEERGATLTPLEVVTTPGTSADINRAIQLLPGVQAVDDGTALFVRGGDFTETKAFLNRHFSAFSAFSAVKSSCDSGSARHAHAMHVMQSTKGFVKKHSLRAVLCVLCVLCGEKLFHDLEWDTCPAMRVVPSTKRFSCAPELKQPLASNALAERATHSPPPV